MVKLCSAHFGFLYHTGRMMQIVKSVYFCYIHCIWVEKRVELPLMAWHVEGIDVRLPICNQTVSQARRRFCF